METLLQVGGFLTLLNFEDRSDLYTRKVSIVPNLAVNAMFVWTDELYGGQ